MYQKVTVSFAMFARFHRPLGWFSNIFCIIAGGSIWSLFIISEYRAYDVENGLEYHHDGRVTTREELECYVGWVNFTITFIAHFLCLVWFI